MRTGKKRISVVYREIMLLCGDDKAKKFLDDIVNGNTGKSIHSSYVEEQEDGFFYVVIFDDTGEVIFIPFE